MVNGGSLAARALFYMSTRIGQRETAATYTTNTVAAVKELQSWYNPADGLWATTGWWNSGNCLTTLADFAQLAPSESNNLDLPAVFKTTFTNAQKNTQTAAKTQNAAGLVSSSYSLMSRRDVSAAGFSGFINNFYDDEGWWALGLIRAYDVNHDNGFLDMAANIFEDMKAGTDNTCGGGIWWSKDRDYKNAIANELYLSVAASLANRRSNKQYYLDIANKQWAWFKGSGMINGQNTINDGLKINADGSCTNNGATTWTYNQGVVLGGLVELARAGGDASLLADATKIASAAISSLSRDGILHESCEPDCGADGGQFKGIFMRNLHYLQKAAPQEAFKAYIMVNADSIWRDDRGQNNGLGVVWTGPPTAGGGPNAGTHSSAMDALVAAMAVA